jgi:hypothetical protein
VNHDSSGFNDHSGVGLFDRFNCDSVNLEIRGVNLLAVLTRREMNFFDRLFFRANLISRAVADLHGEGVARAEGSADPTARTAIELLEPIKNVMGLEDPETWLRVIEDTWYQYPVDGLIGGAMYHRYYLKESAETTCILLCLSRGTYFNWREEFLTYASLTAAQLGVFQKKIKKS